MLWIKTQNEKKLLNSSQMISIYVEDDKICCQLNNAQLRLLGEYESKERIEEVFSFIEDKIIECGKISSNFSVAYLDYPKVFYMPKS